jgi:hypothetical protein
VLGKKIHTEVLGFGLMIVGLFVENFFELVDGLHDLALTGAAFGQKQAKGPVALVNVEFAHRNGRVHVPIFQKGKGL